MNFAYWHWLPYVILWCVVGASLIWFRFFTTSKIMQLFIAAHQKGAIVKHWSWSRFLAKTVVATVAIVGLSLALLGPEIELQEEPVMQEEKSIVIALDVSRSMLAQDCAPNRLACAKAKIKKIVHELVCDRVGLILFSGTAVVMCPLTRDHEAFELFLDDVDAESLSPATTALDKALKKVVEMFESLSSQKNKLALIATDGEDFSATLTSAKEEVIQHDIHLLTLGLGSTQGAPIPVYNESGIVEGHLKDDQGNVVVSRLNEGMLQALARDSKAMYVRAMPDDTDVAAMVSWLQACEKEECLAAKKRVAQPWYLYPAFLSLGCLLLEWIL